MISKNTQNNRGFVALISTLLITIVLMLVITKTSTASFFARFDILGDEFKRRSLGLSEACLNVALLKIAQDYNYLPTNAGEIVAIGSDSCTIRSVTYGSEDPDTHRKLSTIQTSAVYPKVNGSFSTSKITASVRNPAYSTLPSDTLSIESWDEIINIE